MRPSQQPSSPHANTTETNPTPRLFFRTAPAVQYIKGFTINRQQLADFLDVDVNLPALREAIQETLRWIDREAFLFVACGIRPEKGSTELVIALDEDEDEDALKERPLGPLDPTFLPVMPVLEGPSVWLRTA